MESNQLRYEITQAGRHQADARQVVRRHRELLPVRLGQLVSEYRKQRNSAGKSMRLALKDPRYLAWVEELAELSSEAVRARVRWETGRMLWNARQSLNAYYRDRP